MDNRTIKFRQPRFDKAGTFLGFDYWGIDVDLGIGAHFTGPNTDIDALRKSQQFTGIKDKNEKEIYEGDIVKVRSISDGDYQATVAFIKGHFAVTNPNGSWPLYVPLQVEVIGNIYEHAHLLGAL